MCKLAKLKGCMTIRLRVINSLPKFKIKESSVNESIVQMFNDVACFEIVPFVVLLTHTIQILRINLHHRTL